MSEFTQYSLRIVLTLLQREDRGHAATALVPSEPSSVWYAPMPLAYQGEISPSAHRSVGHPAAAPASATGLRAVAVFEAAKGVLVLVAGFGLLALVHHDAQHVAEEVVRRFHLNLAHHHPRILIDALSHIDDARLRLLALAALLYSAMRLIEAYGLWRQRAWAEWFAIVSGGVYLPVELYELIRHATAVKAVVLIVNTGIVAYLIYFRWYRSR